MAFLKFIAALFLAAFLFSLIQFILLFFSIITSVWVFGGFWSVGAVIIAGWLTYSALYK